MTPLCMDPDELDRWEQANRRLNEPAATPCWDCPMPWHDAMRAVGRCNGTPGEPPRPARPSASDRRMEANRLNQQRWRERQRALLMDARVG